MLSSQARVLGEFLVERHVLSRDDLAIAMAESRRTGEALPAVLRAEGLVSEKDLTAAIAETVGVRFVDFTETPLHPDAALTVPEGVAREYQAIGVDFDGARLVVAFPDPGDDAAVQAVGQATGYEIVPAAAGRYEIQHAIDSVFGPAVPALDPTGDARRAPGRGRGRGHPRQRPAEEGARAARLGPPPHRRQPAGDPGARRAPAGRGHRLALRLADPGDDLRDPHAEAAGEVRERARARLLVLAARVRAASVSTSSSSATTSARSCGPSRTRSCRSTTSACPTRCGPSPSCRAAWCSSPGRPAPARARRSPR